MYDLIYWLFISHFTELRFRAHKHYALLRWELYCKIIDEAKNTKKEETEEKIAYISKYLSD